MGLAVYIQYERACVGGTDGQTPHDGKDRAMHSVTWVKIPDAVMNAVDVVD